ncbi:hypothetical protein HC256_003408 [Beauveria bassiana]|uniref:Uncharacterized protein n=1 Tax=Beauveria bassiana (strain ARSEF 2860) TaxID=655819 RepID=J4UM50_BEAB2|nr:uncharacterized protein BBA_05233 [Beauveria bassiana ARSEF 2860]EJP65822.1 hypothetical protein BBA_05233 [Beauveria bassiana ARSEF 2860]KAH8718780.1 hypothetical protein HC256_003408 [Beauveria bassiana]
MVVEILIAVAAGVAICHKHHKKQRINEAFRRDYEARNGPLTEDEWKQLCRDRKRAAKAEKHARRAEAKDRRRGCWRTSVSAPAPQQQPAPVVTAQAQAPKMDVKYDDLGARDDGYAPMSDDKRIWIPVRGPEEEPPAYMPGTGTVPPEKM